MVFRIPALNEEGGMKEETVPLKMAHLLGYHINATSSRILLRCAYGSKLAYTLQVENKAEDKAEITKLIIDTDSS